MAIKVNHAYKDKKAVFLDLMITSHGELSDALDRLEQEKVTEARGHLNKAKAWLDRLEAYVPEVKKYVEACRGHVEEAIKEEAPEKIYEKTEKAHHCIFRTLYEYVKEI